MGSDCAGKCPFIANEPLTLEGRVANAIANRRGVMQRAGLSAVAVGFDWNALMAIARAEGLQDSVASYLFACIETGSMAGIAEAKDGSAE